MAIKVYRWILPVIALVAVALGVGTSVREAYAQEVKCYLMVCTGSVCVANQIPCPPVPPQEETPKNPPPGSST